MTDPYTASRDAARDAIAALFAAMEASSVARDAARKADAHALEANLLARKARMRATSLAFGPTTRPFNSTPHAMRAAQPARRSHDHQQVPGQALRPRQDPR